MSERYEEALDCIEDDSKEIANLRSRVAELEAAMDELGEKYTELLGRFKKKGSRVADLEAELKDSQDAVRYLSKQLRIAEGE